MARWVNLAIVFWSLIALGCAGTPQSLVEPQWTSLESLWSTPNEYGGEYVVVIGKLNFGELPYFQSPVTVRNVKPVIYIRFDGVDANYETDSFRECVEGNAVRVYGRFLYWDEYVSMLDDVYRVEAIKRRTPTPDDLECFVSGTNRPLS